MNTERLKQEDLWLYAVTDTANLQQKTLVEQTESALKGGVTFLQLREKHREKAEIIREALRLKALCQTYQVPFVINDFVDVALAVDADGVHVGQSDMSVQKAREALGPNKLIGATARTVGQALTAQKEGADYLGVGAVFSSPTKKEAKRISFCLLSEICAAVDIPVVAIGGITKDNVCELKGTGIAGIAVSGAVFACPDAETSARSLLTETKRWLQKGI